MLFNSIEFLIFLPIVFFLYWFVTQKSLKAQNALIVFSSYLFYGWWDWRFLSLIIFSSIIDYSIGLNLAKTNLVSKRKLLLLTSIIVNIGFLGYFKYCNFFIDNFVNAFTFFGLTLNPERLDIILPVGISFYTFQTLSYTIDIYRYKIKPTNDIISFFAFVSFFPQLVAGPIERAANLLPQFKEKRIFNYASASDGMRQILWGLFKKVVIADNFAVYVNDIFSHHLDYSGSTLFLAAILFSFQIYCDFSGYSDIAIGTAKLFGFNLMKNFAFPYFSRDIAEFWRRWHISLSTWFRDYIYIPLGGSKGSILLKIRNIFIIFLVSGFWHGANWTFIAWGAIHACFFIPLMLLNQNRNNLNSVAHGKYIPNFIEIFQITITFSLVTLAWIFFRAESINQAIEILFEIFSSSIIEPPLLYPIKGLVLPFIFFIVIDWLIRENERIIHFNFKNARLNHLIYILVIVFIFCYGNFDSNQFIYFQF